MTWLSAEGKQKPPFHTHYTKKFEFLKRFLRLGQEIITK